MKTCRCIACFLRKERTNESRLGLGDDKVNNIAKRSEKSEPTVCEVTRSLEFGDINRSSVLPCSWVGYEFKMVRLQEVRLLTRLVAF